MTAAGCDDVPVAGDAAAEAPGRVDVVRDGAVAELVLTRPGRHNALVPGLLDALVEAVETVGADPQVRAVLLRAAGRSFSTGGDLAAFAARDSADAGGGSSAAGSSAVPSSGAVQFPADARAAAPREEAGAPDVPDAGGGSSAAGSSAVLSSGAVQFPADARAAAPQGEAALAAYAERVVGRLNDAILALARLPVPLVVAWQGPVTGGALGLVLPADVVVASDDAWLQPYYGQVGFAPDGGWTALLPELVGRHRAAEVLVRDRRVPAAELRDWGLVAEVVAGDELLPRARAVTAQAAALAAGTQGVVRRLLGGDGRDPEALAARLDAERRAFVAQVTTDEARAGLRAFTARAAGEASDH